MKNRIIQIGLSASLLIACKNINSTSETKIVGGKKVTEGSLFAKSTVRIEDGSIGHCTGTIIGPQHIVTAAHCVKRPGENFFNILVGTDPKAPKHRLQGAKVLVHPQYRGGRRNYDIAVATFKTPLPADLVAAGIGPRISKGTAITLAGYGRTNDAGENPDGSREKRILRAVQTEVDHVSLSVYRTADNSQGACHGDSGGPAYVENDPLELVGVISGDGYGGCANGVTDIVAVANFKSWIDCAFEQLGYPKLGLGQDRSRIDCPKKAKGESRLVH